MGGSAAAVLYFFGGIARRAHDARPGDVFVARGAGAAYGAEVDAAVGIGCLVAAGTVAHTYCRHSRAPLVEAGVEGGVVVSHDAAGSGHCARAVAGGEGAVAISHDAAGAVAGSGHRARAVAGGEGAVVASRDASGAAGSVHRAGVGAGDEGALAAVASHDAAGAAVGSVHLYLVGAVRHGAVAISRDAAGVVGSVHRAGVGAGDEGALDAVASHDAAGAAVGSGHLHLVVAVRHGAFVASRDASGVVGSVHRAGVGAGDEGALDAVASHDAAGAAVGSGHLHLVVAVRHGAFVASRDASGVDAALHAARHGQVLHRAVPADVSEEALAVVVRAVDGEAGYGVSRTVEGAGVPFIVL